IAIVELKNVRADASVLLQCLRYARWLMSNPDSARLHAQKAGIQVDTTAPRVILVAPEIDPVTVGLAGFMSGNLDFEFIEISRFLVEGEEFISIERLHGAAVQAAAGSRK